MAVVLALSGCSKDAPDTQNSDGKGALKISIASAFPTSRASEGTLASSDAENAVKAFYVYIFDYESGAFERFAEASSDDLTNLSTTITCLPMGNTLRVAVIANPSTNIPKSVSNYLTLQNLPIDLIVDKQTAEDMGTTGLLMTGTSDAVTLTARPNTQEVQVTVSRVVAKVKLGSVTINTAPVGDFALFTLTGVSVQTVMPRANIDPAGPKGVKGSGGYYGGVLGSVSEVLNTKLSNAIELPNAYVLGAEQSFDNYFYVLPNGLVGGNPPTAPTLLTLAATYDGVARYYPVVINKTVAIDTTHGANADATYIKPNYTYTAHIKLKNLAAGSTNPDKPLELADLKVDLVVAPWAGDIVQNDEF